MWFIFQNFISDVEYLLHSIKPTILSIPALSKNFISFLLSSIIIHHELFLSFPRRLTHSFRSLNTKLLTSVSRTDKNVHNLNLVDHRYSLSGEQMSVLGPDTAESSVEMRRGESRTCPVHGRIHLCIGVHVNLCVWMRVLQHCGKWLRVYVYRFSSSRCRSLLLPLPPSCFHCDAAAPDSMYPRDTYQPILLLLNIFCINLWLRDVWLIYPYEVGLYREHT